jgi:hypothetical protein
MRYVLDVLSLSHKLKKYTPIAQFSVESVKFDMQKLNNSGIFCETERAFLRI